MRSLIITLFLSSPILLTAQIQRIVLQGSGDPQVFEQLDDALAAAQPNDRIYFSGGSFTTAAGWVIDMPLHFIGAGIHPDSTSVTGTTTITSSANGSDFTFTTGASGSSFTGIIFDPAQGDVQYGTSTADDDPTNMTFPRCRFIGSVYLGWDLFAVSSSSSVFDECIFNQYFQGRGGAATVSRCIFDWPGNGNAIGFFRPTGLFLTNSVILNGNIGNTDNGVITNNIFLHNDPPVWQSSGNTGTNNLVVADQLFNDPGQNSGSNNITNAVLTDIFVNYDGGVYEFTDDLHLAPGSAGIAAGNDGSDIGLYGSNSPYKPGAVPYNPHFVEADIAPATDADGNLPVNIKVSAQPN